MIMILISCELVQLWAQRLEVAREGGQLCSLMAAAIFFTLQESVYFGQNVNNFPTVSTIRQTLSATIVEVPPDNRGTGGTLEKDRVSCGHKKRYMTFSPRPKNVLSNQ